MGDKQVFSSDGGRRVRWVVFLEMTLGLGAVVMAAFIIFALVTAG